MEINELLKKSKEIWGDEKLTLSQIIVRLGVVYGDICRWERNSAKDSARHDVSDLRKELGNIIFSTIKWCDELGFDPEKCIEDAIECQKKFPKEK